MTNQENLVLIVDDSRATRLMIRKSLEEFGFSVAEAVSGENALEIYSQIKPNVVLLDVEMTGITGIETCARLRQLPDCRYIPIMMVTSRNDPASINKAFEAGATEFTVKPINWDIMGHRVRYLIRTGKSFAELQQSQIALTKAHEELEKINAELEQRVIDRTKQLQSTADELQTTLNTLRTTQAQLIKSEKTAMLGRLLEDVAKDANKPLAMSIKSVTTFQEKVKGFATRHHAATLRRLDMDNFLHDTNQLIDKLTLNLQRTHELIKNFKQLALDKTTESYTRFNLKEYLQEIIYGLRPALKKTQLKVVLNCPQDLIVENYAGVLFRVVMTLVSNSIKHGYSDAVTATEPITGTLTIDVKTDGNKVILKYSDTGKGISEYHLSKIFDPFFTTRPTESNTGLGLYLVHNQVTSIMGGNIECESKLGEGTTFIITFPVSVQHI